MVRPPEVGVEGAGGDTVRCEVVETAAAVGFMAVGAQSRAWRVIGLAVVIHEPVVRVEVCLCQLRVDLVCTVEVDDVKRLVCTTGNC